MEQYRENFELCMCIIYNNQQASKLQVRSLLAFTLSRFTAVKVMEPPSSPVSGLTIIAPLNMWVGVPSWSKRFGLQKRER